MLQSLSPPKKSYKKQTFNKFAQDRQKYFALARKIFLQQRGMLDNVLCLLILAHTVLWILLILPLALTLVLYSADIVPFLGGLPTFAALLRTHRLTVWTPSSLDNKYCASVLRSLRCCVTVVHQFVLCFCTRVLSFFGYATFYAGVALYFLGIPRGLAFLSVPMFVVLDMLLYLGAFNYSNFHYLEVLVLIALHEAFWTLALPGIRQICCSWLNVKHNFNASRWEKWNSLQTILSTVQSVVRLGLQPPPWPMEPKRTVRMENGPDVFECLHIASYFARYS